MTLTPGTHLGRYEIRSKIGEGGMGEVYLAEDLRLHPVRWTPDGRALTYIVTRGLVSNIWAQPVDGGAPGN